MIEVRREKPLGSPSSLPPSRDWHVYIGDYERKTKNQKQEELAYNGANWGVYKVVFFSVDVLVHRRNTHPSCIFSELQHPSGIIGIVCIRDGFPQHQ